MDKHRKKELEERAALLIGHLMSGNVERQQYVGTALSEMPPDEAVDTILFWLTRGKWASDDMFVLIGIVTLYSNMLVPLTFGYKDWKGYVAANILSLVLIALLSSLRNKRIRTKCNEFLVNYDDVRITGVLVKALVKTPQPNVKVNAARALTKLLNKIKPSDGIHISRSARNVLNIMLLESDNGDFVLSILAAWEQIGEAESIPIVERLSHGEGMAGGEARVREAACLAIPAIKAAAERAAVSDVLLRPSESSAPSDDLLRPAQSTHPDSAALLRATTSSTDRL